MDKVTENNKYHLSDLEIGKTCCVLGIHSSCNGLERRRLLDLGILPGTIIQAEMCSPSGDPIAYRIRETVVGLRKEPACMIQVSI